MPNCGFVPSSYGITMFYILTSGSNVEPDDIGVQTLHGASKYGINGAHFESDYTLTDIAVVDDVEVRNGGNTNPNNVPAGGRGTLVWDGTTGNYSIQVVEDKDELIVSNRSNYWAQGGVSMSLNDDTNWENQAEAENLPHMNFSRNRSGLIFDAAGGLWLIATENARPGTFRDAIKELLDDNGVLQIAGRHANGIFLDGGGSTQIRCSTMELTSTREVPQAIVLK
ncbi:hypothetical protein [Natranaerobius trueperi]|uniref:Phosphodiester glycosidase domain-containing protein n=1 Tax=Natranaerobius trueperi TaxID=759412 RepID=A0A226BX55_9FIRM|nr:hypothetical protein [Natranaerobius trueperi]OWZ82687.1 hypothetical protein CDO51_12730 [Natranaerobius trueperi]